MTCIPIPTDMAYALLDEASRRRALTDDESAILEKLVTRGHRRIGIRIQWTPKLDRALLRASHRNGTVRAFAADQNFSEQACYDRLSKLKKLREAKSLSKGERG